MSPRSKPKAARYAAIARVLGIVLGLNLLVAGAKLAYGAAGGALALTADGIHSLLDAASNVIGLVALSAARRPADADHPYWHRKYETVAALAIAFTILLGCYEIVTAVVGRLVEPRAPHVSGWALAVVVGTLAVNACVVTYERRAARRLRSELLEADAAHTGSDVFATLLVLVSLVAVRLGWVWADAVAAIVIVALILRAAISILRGTLATLSDERRLPPAEVEAAALEEPGVREVHNVRSRGPYDDIHLDLHVLVDPVQPLAEAHALGHRVEARLRARWSGLTDVVVHVEPALAGERARRRVGGGLTREE